jgi:hypothetical protein
VPRLAAGRHRIPPAANKLEAMTTPDPRPEPAPADGGAPASESPPEQAHEDTDAAWGEYPVSDDERLYRDRPPHWADY